MLLLRLSYTVHSKLTNKGNEYKKDSTSG